MVEWADRFDCQILLHADGAWWDRLVPSDGAGVVRRSAELYLRALEGRLA